MRRPIRAVAALFAAFALSITVSAAEYDFYGGEVSDGADEYDLGGVIDELPDVCESYHYLGSYSEVI